MRIPNNRPMFFGMMTWHEKTHEFLKEPTFACEISGFVQYLWKLTRGHPHPSPNRVILGAKGGAHRFPVLRPKVALAHTSATSANGNTAGD